LLPGRGTDGVDQRGDNGNEETSVHAA
jgi:hypothetical protein